MVYNEAISVVLAVVAASLEEERLELHSVAAEAVVRRRRLDVVKALPGVEILMGEVTLVDVATLVEEVTSADVETLVDVAKRSTGSLSMRTLVRLPAHEAPSRQHKQFHSGKATTPLRRHTLGPNVSRRMDSRSQMRHPRPRQPVHEQLVARQSR